MQLPVPVELKDGYEELIKNIEAMEPSGTRSIKLASLLLNHPTNPTVEPGLAYIRKEMQRDPAVLSSDTPINALRRCQFLRLCLRVTSTLIERGDHEEAHRILECLKQKYSNVLKLPASQVNVTSPNRLLRIFNNVNILDRLALG
jgi:hypothetical protein